MSNLLTERWFRLAFAEDSTMVQLDEAHGNSKIYDDCQKGWKKNPKVAQGKMARNAKGSCVEEADEHHDEVDELMETDENAFMTKIAHAAVDGEERVIIGDKEYDVDMDKETAEDITGEKATDGAIEEALSKWANIISEDGFDKEKKDRMKCNSDRYLKKGEPGHGTKQKVVKACDPDSDQEKIVKFGDANMKNKSNVDSNRENFRARHNCSDKNLSKDWDAAGYWACKDW